MRGSATGGVYIYYSMERDVHEGQRDARERQRYWSGWISKADRESREMRSGASSSNTESRARRSASSSRTESRERRSASRSAESRATRSASSSTGGDWELERRLEVEGAKRRERKRDCCV